MNKRNLLFLGAGYLAGRYMKKKSSPVMGIGGVKRWRSFQTKHGQVLVYKNPIKSTKSIPQDKYRMILLTGERVIQLGTHPNPTKSAVESIVRQVMK